MEKNTKSLAEIHTAVLLFGLSGLFGRYILLPPVIITFGRVFFASLFAGTLFKLRGTDIRLEKRTDTLAVVAAGIILALHWTSFFASIQASTVAIGVLTFSTYPLFITFAEPIIFKERLRISDMPCAAAMLFGVYIIVPEFSIKNETFAGIAWGMLSSLTYAALSLANRNFAARYKGKVIAFYEQATAAIVLLPSLFILKPQLSFGDIALLALLGVVFTACAHSMFIGGMKNIRAQTAGMISGLESPYGIASAALIFGEIPSANEFIGGAIILGTALWSTLKGSRS